MTLVGLPADFGFAHEITICIGPKQLFEHAVGNEGLSLLVELMEKHVILNSMQFREVMSMLALLIAFTAVPMSALHALHAIMLSVCNTLPSRREHEHEACNGQLPACTHCMAALHASQSSSMCVLRHVQHVTHLLNMSSACCHCLNHHCPNCHRPNCHCPTVIATTVIGV